MKAPKYTLYVVSRSADHHYPVIMANNGKACLNEPVKRRAKMLESAERFLSAALDGSEGVRVECMSEAAFRERFPRFAPNLGGRPAKTAKTKGVKTFKRGDKVVVKAGNWGTCNATVIRKGEREDLWRLRITSGAHTGHTGLWSAKDITAR